MKLHELLLPKSLSNKGLSSSALKAIDGLQTRMDMYVDKICKLSAGTAQDFLKSKLRADYNSLKSIINKHSIAEDVEPVKYEVVDRHTKEVVGGPYSTRARANRAVDRLDNQYGGYRYIARPITTLNEAIHKLPLTPNDFEMVKKMMENPIPAIVAPIYIMEIIDDDELNDQLRSLEETEPGRDIRPLVAEWFNRVMPDQMFRFGQNRESIESRRGIFSPIHGYDPCQFSGSTDTGTQSSGNAYGSF